MGRLEASSRLHCCCNCCCLLDNRRGQSKELARLCSCSLLRIPDCNLFPRTRSGACIPRSYTYKHNKHDNPDKHRNSLTNTQATDPSNDPGWLHTCAEITRTWNVNIFHSPLPMYSPLLLRCTRARVYNYKLASTHATVDTNTVITQTLK